MQDSKNEAKASNGKVMLVTNSTFGNFDISASCEVASEIVQEAANKGFLWEIQRSPAGAAEFALTGFDGKTKVKPSIANGASKDWTRTDILFTEANASVIKKELENRANYAKKSFLPDNAKIVVVVTEHVATAPEPKFRAARNLIEGKLALKESLSELAKTVGYKAGGKLDSNNEPFVEAVGRYMAALRP